MPLTAKLILFQCYYLNNCCCCYTVIVVAAVIFTVVSVVLWRVRACSVCCCFIVRCCCSGFCFSSYTRFCCCCQVDIIDWFSCQLHNHSSNIVKVIVTEALLLLLRQLLMLLSDDCCCKLHIWISIYGTYLHVYIYTSNIGMCDEILAAALLHVSVSCTYCCCSCSYCCYYCGCYRRAIELCVTTMTTILSNSSQYSTRRIRNIWNVTKCMASCMGVDVYLV